MLAAVVKPNKVTVPSTPVLTSFCGAATVWIGVGAGELVVVVVAGGVAGGVLGVGAGDTVTEAWQSDDDISSDWVLAVAAVFEVLAAAVVTTSDACTNETLADTV